MQYVIENKTLIQKTYKKTKKTLSLLYGRVLEDFTKSAGFLKPSLIGRHPHFLDTPST